MQKALCTYVVKGHTVQKAVHLALLHPKLGTNTFKSHGSHKGPKVHQAPRRRIWSMRTKVRPQYTKRVRIDDSGPTFAARGPRAEGARGEVNLPQ